MPHAACTQTATNLWVFDKTPKHVWKQNQICKSKPSSYPPKRCSSKTKANPQIGLRIFPASIRPLPGVFPLRPGIFSASGIYFVSSVFFLLPQALFLLPQRVFLASERICPASIKSFSCAERYFSRFRHFCRFQKIFFPLRKKYVFRFGPECDKRTASKNFPATKKYLSRFGAETAKKKSRNLRSHGPPGSFGEKKRRKAGTKQEAQGGLQASKASKTKTKAQADERASERASNKEGTTKKETQQSKQKLARQAKICTGKKILPTKNRISDHKSETKKGKQTSKKQKRQPNNKETKRITR